MNRSAMDLSAALERIDGDRDLFLTLAEMFIERSAQDLAAIQQAVLVQDAANLAKQAHKLKGLAMEFCAQEAVAAAKQLEETARQLDLGDAAALCQRVEAELMRLTGELQEIIAKGFPS